LLAGCSQSVTPLLLRSFAAGFGEQKMGPTCGSHWKGTIQGKVMNILDYDKNRQAAERYRCFGSSDVPGSKHLEHQDILHKLLRDSEATGSRRQREGTKWLRFMLTQDLAVGEIAAIRKTTKDDVRHLLSQTRKRMRTIAETRYNFTAKDL